MPRIIHDPYSGSHRIEGREHLGSYTDKAAAKEALKNDQKLARDSARRVYYAEESSARYGLDMARLKKP
jgi:hypothetical protein